MSVIKAKVQVLDPIGLHARPASQIVKLVKEHSLDVSFRKSQKGSEPVEANSALRLLALKAKAGETLTVEISTTDKALAKEVIAKIQEFLKG
jgi:phosphocarrier protein HPr